MRIDTCTGFVCVWTLLATPVLAQSTTEDGIRAMLRGDYAAAARILRPLADAARPDPDPVAQFFLAVLFETGQGVKADMVRACGLFLTSAARAHPFSEQSASISASMREQFGAGASLLCADESWQGGPPQSFSLGPSHRVVFADTVVTVTYGEQETRMAILNPPGAAFLPIEYRPLAVTQPEGVRRHFFQWFYWTPDAAAHPASWSLDWVLSEVVGDHWVAITGEKSLAVVKGSARPESREATNLVRLRVNASGEAEFALVGATSPRTEVIPWQGSR